MNFSAVFSELFILAYLVWNFLQLSLLSDFQLPSLWCLTPCSYWKCSSFPWFTNPWNTLLWPHSLSQLCAFLKACLHFPLPPCKQGIWGPVNVRVRVSICHEKCAVLIFLGSHQIATFSFPLKPSWLSFARNCKSWANLQGICHVCTKLKTSS